MVLTLILITESLKFVLFKATQELKRKQVAQEKLDQVCRDLCMTLVPETLTLVHQYSLLTFYN